MPKLICGTPPFVIAAAALLTLLTLLPRTSGAQALPDGESSTSPQDTVVIRGKRTFDDRFSSTASTITVGRQDIEAMGANTIGDIMRQLPGMQVTTTANGGLEIRMRGMGPENTRIQIDGVPVSASRQTTQLPLDELPADLIERVEVVRSPTAESEGAAGGTINIVLRPARAKRETYLWISNQHVWGHNAPDIFVSQTGPLGATSEAKSDNVKASDVKSSDGSAELAALSQPTWSYFVSLIGGKRWWGSDTDRDRQSNNGGVITATSVHDAYRGDNNYWTLTPRISGRLSATDQITIRTVLSTLAQQGSVQTGGTAQNAGALSTIAGASSWTYQRNFYQFGLDWVHRFKDAKLDTSLTLERANNVYRLSRDQTANPSSAPVQPNGFANDQSERTVVATSKLSGVAGKSLWTTGTELDLRHNEAIATTISAGVANPQDLNASIQRTALWAQNEMPIESLKSTVTVGLRAQNYSIRSDTVGANVDYQKLFLQPSLNARTRLGDDTQLRWNLARLTRTPRIWELLERVLPNQASNGPNSPDFIGNAKLKPEVTVSADVGIDQRFADGGQAGINLFLRDQTDVIARRLFLQGTQWVEQPSNVGDAIVWGLEADLRRDLRWAGLGPEWTMSANGSLLQSRMRNGEAAGSRIPGQARYLANLTVAKPLRVSGGWYGGSTLSIVGASELNTASAPGVTVAGNQKARAQLDLYFGSVDPRYGFWRLSFFDITSAKRDTNRVIVDSAGIVYSDHSVQRLTTRVFFTVGTRF